LERQGAEPPNWKQIPSCVLVECVKFLQCDLSPFFLYYFKKSYFGGIANFSSNVALLFADEAVRSSVYLFLANHFLDKNALKTQILGSIFCFFKAWIKKNLNFLIDSPEDSDQPLPVGYIRSVLRLLLRMREVLKPATARYLFSCPFAMTLTRFTSALSKSLIDSLFMTFIVIYYF
jgi:hypothetical protein